MAWQNWRLEYVLEQLLHVCTGRGMRTRNNPQVHKHNRYIVVDFPRCNTTQQGNHTMQYYTAGKINGSEF